jgi:hypothetical protein
VKALDTEKGETEIEDRKIQDYMQLDLAPSRGKSGME